jgi:hypothetical protein
MDKKSLWLLLVLKQEWHCKIYYCWWWRILYITTVLLPQSVLVEFEINFLGYNMTFSKSRFICIRK